MRMQRSARNADFLGPDVVGLVVVDVDRGPELVLRQLVDLGQQLPRIADRVALEIVAEAEVAQHLEERVMPRRVADVFEVVVLAARAQRLLRRRRALVGALLAAGEHVLELHHAAVDEQQRRVVGRHEARGAHDRVALGLEVLQESFADVGAFHDCMTARRMPRSWMTLARMILARADGPARALSDGRSTPAPRWSDARHRPCAPRARVPKDRRRR